MDATVNASPLLLKAEDAAGVLGMSRAEFYKLHSAAKVPRPLKLTGKLVRWRRDELAAWVTAGCPNREKWEVRA
jgi:predicted DNA-binding transcriptional regulator AlpA